MGNPYKIDPEAFREKRKTAKQEYLISLQDDSAHPPPTVNSSSFQGIFFGPAAGQPSKANDDTQTGWGKVLGKIFFWTWVLLVVIGAIYRFMR